jgi:hypothetical protein
MTVHQIRPESRSLEDTVRSAVQDMDWLRPSDQPAVELALKYAKWLDGCIQADYVAKDVGQRFEKVLIELGLTPKARIALVGKESTVTGRLAELRKKREA